MKAVCKTLGYICATGTAFMFLRLLDVLASDIPLHLTSAAGALIRLEMTIYVLVSGAASVACFQASET